MQECSWQHFFSGTSPWRDNRQRKPTSRHPDFKHKESKVDMWLNSQNKPPWLDLHLAAWEAGTVKRNEGLLDFEMCRKLCDDGRLNEAVDALNLLVQRGHHVPSNLLYLLIKRCIADRELVLGRQVHTLAVESGYEGDDFLATQLIRLYASHRKLEEAMRVFTKVPTPSVYSWGTIIFAYAKNEDGAQAIRLYRQMQQSTVKPDNRIYSAVLKACASAGDICAGKEVHAHILAGPGKPDSFVQSGLLVMYAKCGGLEEARGVFDKFQERDVVAWNAMLAGYAQKGMGQEALSLYSRMQQEGLSPPSSVTFVCVLQACASIGVGALLEGRKLHAQIEARGLQDDVVLGGSLVNMYAKCGTLEDARSVFDRLPDRNIVTWNAMLGGYAQRGMGQEALSLHSCMQQEASSPPTSVTFVCLLQACASIGERALHEGKKVHAQIKERGLQHEVVLGGSLVNMYAKCGSLVDARSVFDSLKVRNMVTWNAMFAGYAQQGMGPEALSLYGTMQQEGLFLPDSVTFTSLLQSCASVGVGGLLMGKQLHAQIRQRALQDDVVLGGSLVNMYAKCGSLEDARNVFDSLKDRNMVTWNAMLAGYAQQGMSQEVLILYNRMQGDGLFPDSVTCISLLQSCASVGVEGLHHGKQLHALIKERGSQEDVVLGCSLVNMYAKCGSLEDARSVFDRLPSRDVVTWNAMLAGYVQRGMVQEAISLYTSMQLAGLCPPNSFTFVCLLQACATVAGLPLGKRLHAEIEEQGMQADVVVGGALVNMYAKCGSMSDSQQVFDSLPEKSIEAWGALIGGYSRHGDSEVVFDLLDRMRLQGMQPTEIIFLSVLTVCSHVGLVDKGRKYFDVMEEGYGITPSIEHYTCMMDLLGRAGHLEEALQMAKNMPFPPDDAVFVTLLGACRKWNNVEIGQQAFKCAVTLGKKDSAPYVLMSNIYARAQMWEEAKELQARRKNSGAWKEPGQSWWTDMGGMVHTFVVGDKTHQEGEGIYARLEQLIPKLKKEGYVPHLDSSLRDIPDHEKEAELCGHSEKLAIAYALNRTPEGTTIRVAKNLRVCEDCHTATAYISKVEKRTIICRDASRFHVYKEGKCSCGDYW